MVHAIIPTAAMFCPTQQAHLPLANKKSSLAAVKQPQQLRVPPPLRREDRKIEQPTKQKVRHSLSASNIAAIFHRSNQVPKSSTISELPIPKCEPPVSKATTTTKELRPFILSVLPPTPPSESGSTPKILSAKKEALKDHEARRDRLDSPVKTVKALEAKEIVITRHERPFVVALTKFPGAKKLKISYECGLSLLLRNLLTADKLQYSPWT